MRTLPAATLAFLLVASMCHGASAGISGLAGLYGLEVVKIEAQGADISAGELSTFLPFEAGSPLRPQLVREGVANLYGTGRYNRVEVFASESPEGVSIRYVLTPKKLLEKVVLRGNLYIDDRSLATRLDLRPGDEITAEKMDRNIRSLMEYYETAGFARTSITHRLEPGSKNRTRVVFEIREGERRFVSDVRITGDAGLSRLRVLSIIASMPGAPLNGFDLDKDIDRLRGYLRKRMHLIPDLSYRIEPSPDFENGAVVVIRMEKGPEFRLRVQMEDGKESSKLTRRMRSVFMGSTSPEKAKLSMRKQVLDRFHKEGYPFVAVDYTDESVDRDIRAITLRVDKGLKTLVGGVKIEGAEFFGTDEIETSLGLVMGEPFVEAALERGLEKVEQDYRAEGYLSVVLTRKRLKYRALGGYQEVVISLQIEEGQRNTINSLTISGSPFEKHRTLEIMELQEGAPYVPEVVSAGGDRLLRELGGLGYLYSSLSIGEPLMNSDGSADLSVTVEPGPRVRLGSVIIRGNESVDDRIIRLALDLRRGEVLTLDKILAAQERIYDLKVMSSVDVRLDDPQAPGRNKDLVVLVEERPEYVIGLRGGYGSEDQFRGEASVTDRNLMRMARSLTLTGRTSAIERNTTLLYLHPWFASLPIEMTASLSDLVEERESYSRDSLSASVDFVRGLSELTESRIGYFFEGLRLFDVSPDAQLSPEDEGSTDVAALVGEILHDARDDFLDPWSGLLGDVIVEYAARELGSRTEYIKTELSIRSYTNPVDEIVLAGLLRLGRVAPYGRSEEVIISKRFFLGGQNSVRGYRLDSLGPRDTDGDPIGGNYLVNANLEARYPVYRTLRGVLFLDSGSVWLNNAASPEDERFKLRFSTGAGLRWTSPIGPLSLDYGYKLNPAEDDRDIARWHFSIGHAF